MMRCSCMRCLLADVLVLLRKGHRVSMAVLLLEQALEAEEKKTKRVAPPARARKARARP
jgi:hypothetical protein